MIYNILFVICGIGLIALGLSLFKLDCKVESWAAEVLHHVVLINDVDNKRFEDAHRLDEAFKRIQELEDRLEAQAAELTEHHNKIDTLEINGTVYEGIFEQQGLWGEDSEVPEFPDPEDEGIINYNS